MKRSKSASNQKLKKEAKCQSARYHKKQLKIETVNTAITCDNNAITQRPLTSRNGFEERLNKIRQGFEDLQKNLSYNPMNEQQQILAPITSDLTSRKMAKKLFGGESNKKTKSKKKQINTSSKKTVMRSPFSQHITPKNKYHSCLYQKSLYNLMKIVISQKSEITRLSNEIKSHRGKK